MITSIFLVGLRGLCTSLFSPFADEEEATANDEEGGGSRKEIEQLFDPFNLKFHKK